MSDEQQRDTIQKRSITASPDAWTNLPVNEASRSALEAPNDVSLRVPCFCEENVWRLARRKLQWKAKSTWCVVFVSNASQCVPMFHQKTTQVDEPCLWDYHVLLLEQDERGHFHVLDIDSRLPYPCPLGDYLNYSFPKQVPAANAPLFRVVGASVFVEHFYSDRMHMVRDDKWISPPPPYPCIGVTESQQGSNLDRYRKMQTPARKGMVDLEATYGTVLNVNQLLAYCRGQQLLYRGDQGGDEGDNKTEPRK